MSIPFWVHCNICSTFHSSGLKMYLMNCQHILCRNCMTHTKNGSVCPICRASIKFMELGKLPEGQLKYFQENITSNLTEPKKMIKFQQSHQYHLYKLSKSYKEKSRKMQDFGNKLKDQIYKKKQQFDQMHQRRKQMQDKLKQIYQRKKEQRMNQYRNKDSSISSNSMFSPASQSSKKSSNNSSFLKSSIISSASSNQSNSKNLIGDFFQPNAPCFKNSTQAESSRSTIQKTQRIQSSQSNRSPFFA